MVANEWGDVAIESPSDWGDDPVQAAVADEPSKSYLPPLPAQGTDEFESRMESSYWGPMQAKQSGFERNLIDVPPGLVEQLAFGPSITPLERGMATRGAQIMSGITSPKALSQIPLFLIPVVREALMAKYGTEAIGSGSGEVVEGLAQGDMEMVGGGLMQTAAGGAMIAPLPKSIRATAKALKRPAPIATPPVIPPPEPFITKPAQTEPAIIRQSVESKLMREPDLPTGEPSGLSMVTPEPARSPQGGIPASMEMLELLPEQESLRRAVLDNQIPGDRPGIISGTKLEGWADEVLKGGATHLGPDVLAAYAVKGAALLEKGIVNSVEWTTEMLKQYGPEIRKHLPAIRAESEQLRAGAFAKGVQDALHKETTGTVRTVQQPGGPQEGAIQMTANVPGEETAARGGSASGAKASEVPLTSESVESSVKPLKLEFKEQSGFEEMPGSWQFNYQPEGKTVFTFQMEEGSSLKQISERLAQKQAQFEAVKTPPKIEGAIQVSPEVSRAMEKTVKLPAEENLQKTKAQFDLFLEEIGEALTSGGQFLPKDLRPKVAKGQPAETGTVTSKQINQYFVNKLSTAMRQLDDVSAQVRREADADSATFVDLLRKRAQQAFRQVQELRRASHESLYFWNEIKAEFQEIARMAGQVPQMRRQLPVLDQIWKDLRQKEYADAGRHFVDYLRMNLFTMGSWTLDFGTNLAVLATRVPAWAILDAASLVSGKPALRMATAFRAAQLSARNLIPATDRFRLMDRIESELGTTAGAEFAGSPKNVMVDFSEILSSRPELAAKLKPIDHVIGLPVRLKRSVDTFFGRLGAATELYHFAYREGRENGLTGDSLKSFVERYVDNPPVEATEKAIKTGKEFKFNRDLMPWEERFANNIVTKLVVESFPRWTFQFVRWAGEMIGVDPSFYRAVTQGKATPELVVNYLTRAATGWGGIYFFNRMFYDNIDANTMEYVKEDGNRVRLSGRTPAPELFFVNALLRGDVDKAKAALSHLSVPGAKLLSGQPAGILSPLIDTVRESWKGNYTAEQTARELTDIVNNAIPGKSVMGLARALYDPAIREGIGAPVPGVSAMLPERIDPTTGKALAPRQRVPGTGIEIPTVAGTPFPGAERVLNDVQKVLLNHGFGLTRPRRTSIISLPAEDVPKEVRREYERRVGMNVKRIVGEGIRSPEWKALEYDQRRHVLSVWMEVSRKLARAELAQEKGVPMKPVKTEPLNVQRLPDRLRQ